MIVHEAFGHGVEMDMFVKKRALAEQFAQAGADAIIGIHYGSSQVMQGAAEMVAYGTAVKILKKKSE